MNKNIRSVLESNENFSELFYSLNELEQKTLRLLWGDENNEPETVESIAEQLKVSPERVRQLETKAIRKLTGCRCVRKTARLRDFIKEDDK